MGREGGSPDTVPVPLYIKRRWSSFLVFFFLWLSLSEPIRSSKLVSGTYLGSVLRPSCLRSSSFHRKGPPQVKEPLPPRGQPRASDGRVYTKRDIKSDRRTILQRRWRPRPRFSPPCCNSRLRDESRLAALAGVFTFMSRLLALLRHKTRAVALSAKMCPSFPGAIYKMTCWAKRGGGALLTSTQIFRPPHLLYDNCVI